MTATQTVLKDQLKGMFNLTSNWDSYGAEPPNGLAMFNTERVLDMLRVRLLDATQVVPSAEGGCGVVLTCRFKPHTHYACIECTNDGMVTAMTSDRSEGTDDGVHIWYVSNMGVLDPLEPSTLSLTIDETLERIRMFLWADYTE